MALLRRGGSIPLHSPTGCRVAQKRSETVKLMIVILASVASALLVVPTVTQAEPGAAHVNALRA
jgi:hypothetical protein